MPKYYAIQQSGRVATLNIYGDLTPWVWEPSDVSAWSVKEELDAIDADEIHVHINSYGGSVSEGFAIYNALRAHKARVNTYADGFVASAAIYPFLAGEKRVANPVSAFYFHQVMITASGNAEELRKAAANADTLNELGLQAFEAAGVPAETAKELELRDCFVGPAEMVRLGVATELGRKDEDEGATQSILPGLIRQLLERRKDEGDRFPCFARNDGAGTDFSASLGMTEREAPEGAQKNAGDGQGPEPTPKAQSRLRALLGLSEGE